MVKKSAFFNKKTPQTTSLKLPLSNLSTDPGNSLFFLIFLVKRRKNRITNQRFDGSQPFNTPMGNVSQKRNLPLRADKS